MPYPDNGPGTRRFDSFCRYLSEQGFDVTLLALAPWGVSDEIQPPDGAEHNFEVIRLPNSLNPSSLLARLQYHIADKALPQFQSYYSINRATWHGANDLLSKRQFDCMITTYPPMGSLRVIDALSRRHKIPWVADLRDIPDEHDPQRSHWITRRRVYFLSHACASASHILTVSKPLKEHLKSQYGMNVPVTVVYNGFEENHFEALESSEASKSFDVTYCGSLGYGRSPTLLFEGLDLLISRGVDINHVRICFYGRHNPNHLGLNRFYSSKLIRYYGMVDHRETLVAEKNSAILLSLSCPTSAKGIISCKIFDYAMIGRPVLSIPPDNSTLDEFVREANIGSICATAEDVADTIGGYLEMWHEKGRLPKTNPNMDYLMKFSRRAQAMKFGEILERLCGHSHSIIK